MMRTSMVMAQASACHSTRRPVGRSNSRTPVLVAMANIAMNTASLSL